MTEAVILFVLSLFKKDISFCVIPFQNVTDSDIEEATPDVVILEEDSENDDLIEIE